VKTLAIVIVLTAGCSWSQFSDLSNQTPLHGQGAPDSDQSDYAVGIVNVAAPGSPGELAVLSGSPPNYSTLGLQADGATNETFSEGLGDFSLNALSSHPAFVSDDAGDVAIVEIGVDKGLVLIAGTADKLSDQGLATTEPVGAATFAGSTIVVAAAPSSGKPNGFVISTTALNCDLAEPSGSAMDIVALASDGSDVYAYGRDGLVVSYDLSALTSGCTTSETPMTPVPTKGSTTIAAAQNGGYLALVGTFAIAVAFDSASSTTGMVSVIDVTTMTAVGTPIAAAGAQSAAFGSFGPSPGMPALALGFPTRTVGTTTDVGEVELHLVDTAAGSVDPDAGDMLSIPQAGGDLLFGRGVAAVTFNGATILVAAANNEVYTYYATSLYSDTRQQ
jgi:hypothetical protein